VTLPGDIKASPRDIGLLIASAQTMSSPSEEPNTTIVTYRPEFREAFERLNRAWLEAHSLLEPADVEFLHDPEAHILSSGGQIFCALQAGEVVGTCAAIRCSPSVFELAKLAVAPVAQGRGLGRQLSKRVIRFARDAGASKIELTSHTDLAQAIRLYESLGFQHEPIPPDVRYQTANVYMTLNL
jgi:ribosomal protein S18 acetylase RimI-like enzyme